MSEEEELIGADFAEHGIIQPNQNIDDEQYCKQCSITLHKKGSKKEMSGRKHKSTYCNNGILNFGYLSINEKIIAQQNHNNTSNSTSENDVKIITLPDSEETAETTSSKQDILSE